jgi:hypothetical protein
MLTIHMTGDPNMLENIRFSNPDTLAKPPGYSNVVEVTGPGRTVYLAGAANGDNLLAKHARQLFPLVF